MAAGRTAAKKPLGRWWPALLLAAGACLAAASNPYGFSPSECRPPFSLPAPIPGTPYLGFFALGDTGTGSDKQATVAAAMGQFTATISPSFVLLLGDNFYPDGVTSISDPQWQAMFEQKYLSAHLPVPFYGVLAGRCLNATTRSPGLLRMTRLEIFSGPQVGLQAR